MWVASISGLIIIIAHGSSEKTFISLNYGKSSELIEQQTSSIRFEMEGVVKGSLNSYFCHGFLMKK